MIGHQRRAGEAVELAHLRRRDGFQPRRGLGQHEWPAHADAMGGAADQPGQQHRRKQGKPADVAMGQKSESTVHGPLLHALRGIA